MRLEDCRSELKSIIRELRDIEDGVRRDFTGIGEDLCADCIDEIAAKYDWVLDKLNNVDTNLFAE